MNLSSSILENLSGFVKDKFPDVYAAFLTGSAVDEYFNDESDYDIYVITYTRDYVFNESFVSNGMKLQLIHLPLEKIDDILWYDIFTRTGIHLSSFNKGKILIDCQDYLSNLIKDCQVIFNAGPAECSPNDLKSHKIGVMNLISDLSGNNYEEEKIILSHELYRAFIKFYLEYNGRWNSKNKHLARQMKNTNPHLLKALLEELKEFHQSLDPTGLLLLINKEVAIIGDIDNGYSQYPGLINVKSNYIILNLYGVADFYELRSRLLKLSNSFFQEVDSFFTFRSRPLGDDETITESLYLVLQVHSEKEANENLMPKIKNLLSTDQLNKIKIHYPVNFDFDLFLGGKKLLNPMFSLFHLVSNKFCERLINESDSIFYSFNFIRAFKQIFFNEENEKWLSFLNFLSDRWLTRAYDNKKIHNITQIIESRKSLLSNYEDQYNSQKTILANILAQKNESEEDNLIIIELEQVRSSITSQIRVKPHQQHPSANENRIVAQEWIVYKNMLDYILGILMYKEAQKPYFIFALIQLYN